VRNQSHGTNKEKREKTIVQNNPIDISDEMDVLYRIFQFD